MIAIVSCIANDTESCVVWQRLLGGPSKAMVLTEEEARELSIATQVKFGSLLLVGIEPLQRLSKTKSHNDLVQSAVARHFANQQQGAADEMSEEALNELVTRLAIEALLSPSDVDSEFSTTSLSETCQQLIRNFYAGNLSVVGVGSGSIEICRALGGETKPLNDVRMRFEPVRHQEEDSLLLPAAKSFLSRIVESEFSTLPALAVHLALLQEEDEPTVVAFGIPCLENIAKNQGRRLCVLALNASPEISSEMLIEEFFPKLDDHLLLSAPEALLTIDSVKHQVEQQDVDEVWMDLVKRVLHVEKDDINEISQIAILEARVQELEEENAKLKQELLLLKHNSSVPTDKVTEKSAAADDDDATSLSVKSLLLGLALSSSPEEIHIAESSLTRVLLNPAVSASSAGVLVTTHSSASSVLALCYTNEGELVYGGTDRLVHFPKESFAVDAPPVFIVASPLSVPTQIAIGTLGGSIILVDTGSNERITLENNPHKKHITALVFDPTGTTRLASVSRDGILVLWSAARQPTATFAFHADKPAECATSVILEGVPYLAVAKRNDFRVSLIPFNAGEEGGDSAVRGQRFFSLNEQGGDDFVSFAPLAMASFRDLPVVAVATDKSRVIVYDVRNGGSRLREFWGHVCDEFARPSIMFSPHGDCLAVTSTPNKVFLFNVAQPRTPPVVIEDHKAAVRCLAFHVDVNGQQYLTTGSFDKTVIVREI